MPQTKSAKKALRSQKRKQLVNTAIKQRLVKLISMQRKKPTLANLKKAISALDRAASKKVIPKQKAARLKSRLSQRIRQA